MPLQNERHGLDAVLAIHKGGIVKQVTMIPIHGIISSANGISLPPDSRVQSVHVPPSTLRMCKVQDNAALVMRVQQAPSAASP